MAEHGSESKSTVLVALAANLAIAVAKLVGGLISGSSAMLAEAAHSVADTMNQVFLLRGLKASARPADMVHPFGYGKVRFFWSLLAAVAIFVGGAVFSFYEGISTIVGEGGEEGGVLIAYAVLLVSFLAEGTSWLRAVRQLRAEATSLGRTFREHLGLSTDPTVKTVFAEDTAAVIGLALAAAGIGLHQATGEHYWDGIAAVLIGVLLTVVAFTLGKSNGDLLIGEAARPELVVGAYDTIAGTPGVDRVVELLTMALGPEDVLLAVRVDLRNDLPAGAVEDLSTQVERELVGRWPEVTQVFLDATRAVGPTADRTAAYVETLRRGLPAPAVGATRRR
ncbi:cation diffusion facilitator family transporter [Motilibacter aurantiacus]|uniref:cation diffusion facilitator family transporter n=1 Tax=Motilibacter aurantiacus TaxID=2714955 RepID=UPI00140796A8|nr:cation diffusion facilitator family transporter [Motilibacter aurantiacus]